MPNAFLDIDADGKILEIRRKPMRFDRTPEAAKLWKINQPVELIGSGMVGVVVAAALDMIKVKFGTMTVWVNPARLLCACGEADNPLHAFVEH